MPNHGTAHLTVAVQANRSVVIEQFGKAPLQLHRPLYLDAKSFPTVFLRTPSYGLLDGDIHELFVQVEAGAELEMRTQGATLVYPGMTEQKIHIRVAAGGRLRFLPHPLILAAHASLKQRIKIEIDQSSSVAFKESWVCGRVAMGERWKFAEFDNLVEIECQNQLLYRESFIVRPEKDNLTHPAICGDFTGFETRFDYGETAVECVDASSDQVFWYWRRERGQITKRAFCA